MSETPMRAAFEAWFLREYPDVGVTRCPWLEHRDKYLMPAAQTSWIAWQAGVVWFNG